MSPLVVFYALHRCLLERDGLGSRSDKLAFAYIQKRSVFLNFSTVDVLGGIILCCAGCLVHCRMLSRIFGTHLLDARSSPHPLVTQKSLQISPKRPLGAKFNLD